LHHRRAVTGQNEVMPSDEQLPRAAKRVDFGAHGFFDAARVLVGVRFAEARFDPDGGARVAIIDLDDQDVAALSAAAERFGIGSEVRIERADPGDLANWERLRKDLRRLQDINPRPLQTWPSTEQNYRRPPADIRLAPHAEAIAAALYASYGEFVSLTVGALPYPLRAMPPIRALAQPVRETASPTDMRFALDGPLTVRSGETVNHALLLTNLTDEVFGVASNGHLTAMIVADDGALVGGHSGVQRGPLIPFTARAGQTIRIPLLVGTASYRPELGFAIPPGRWHLTAPLNLRTGRERGPELVTPPLEFAVIA
jgi:hypothetical protein